MENNIYFFIVYLFQYIKKYLKIVKAIELVHITTFLYLSLNKRNGAIKYFKTNSDTLNPALVKKIYVKYFHFYANYINSF